MASPGSWNSSAKSPTQSRAGLEFLNLCEGLAWSESLPRRLMRYDDRASRLAYIQGARDAFESLVMRCPPADARQVEEWLGSDLANWEEGEPPAAPYLWADAPA